jgi:hypothetical protein
MRASYGRIFAALKPRLDVVFLLAHDARSAVRDRDLFAARFWHESMA